MVTQVVNTAQNLTRRVLYEHKTREDKNVSTNPGDLLSPLWSPNYTPTSRNVISPIRTTTAVYAGRLYDVTGSTKNRYVYAGDELVATIERVGTSTPTVRYVHTDHLGGTNVLTNASSTEAQVLDYYPFGEVRVDDDTDSVDVQKQFIGEYADDTDLSYLNARYYDGGVGRFVSQDPTHLATFRATQFFNAF